MNGLRNFRCIKIVSDGTMSYNNGLTHNLNKFRSSNIHRSYMGETYEGTGKTTGHIVNKKGVSSICIESVTAKGFKLTNGWMVVGPTIFFPHRILSWNIKSMDDISKESLSIFSVLNPKVDMLLLGIGIGEDLTYEKVKELIQICKAVKINFEVMSTINAVATFNFCSLENRYVSAALIPPLKVTHHHGLNLIERSNLPDVKH